jgi:hypothetical protein
LAVSAGRSLLAGLVRAVPVVVDGLLAQDRLQVPFTVDEHPVGAFGPGPPGAAPALVFPGETEITSGFSGPVPRRPAHCRPRKDAAWQTADSLALYRPDRLGRLAIHRIGGNRTGPGTGPGPFEPSGSPIRAG